MNISGRMTLQKWSLSQRCLVMVAMPFGVCVVLLGQILNSALKENATYKTVGASLAALEVLFEKRNDLLTDGLKVVATANSYELQAASRDRKSWATLKEKMVEEDQIAVETYLNPKPEGAAAIFALEGQIADVIDVRR